MRLRQIEVFHAIYTSGTMTNAASLLHVSQPAISKVLAHTEQQLGYPLFDRVKGRLIATPEAHELFSHVAKVYHDIDQLRSISRNLCDTSKGRIRIAATPAIGVYLLPSAIASFHKFAPDLRFDVDTLHHQQISDSLLRKRIDVGFSFNPEPMPAIAHQVLNSGAFMVVVPQEVDLAQNQSVQLSELESYPLVTLRNKGPLGRQLSTLIDSSGIKFNVVATCETYHIAKTLVAKGMGITIVDEITARSGQSDKIASVPLDPALRFDITASHHEGTPLSVMSKKFISHMQKSADALLKNGQID